MFSIALQSTCARDRSIEAVGTLVAGDVERVAGRRGQGAAPSLGRAGEGERAHVAPGQRSHPGLTVRGDRIAHAETVGENIDLTFWIRRGVGLATQGQPRHPVGVIADDAQARTVTRASTT